MRLELRIRISSSLNLALETPLELRHVLAEGVAALVLDLAAMLLLGLKIVVERTEALSDVTKTCGDRTRGAVRRRCM